MIRMSGVFVALCGLCFAVNRLEGQDQKGAAELQMDQKEIFGTVKVVDLKKNSFTITTILDEKANTTADRTFGVMRTTKFMGPMRAVSAEGLKDDRMDKGYEIRVVYNVKDEKNAEEVHLPFRKKKDESKKEEAKAKN